MYGQTLIGGLFSKSSKVERWSLENSPGPVAELHISVYFNFPKNDDLQPSYIHYLIFHIKEP